MTNRTTRAAHPVNPRNPKASPKQQTGRNAWWHADFASERRRLMAGSGGNGKHAAISRGLSNPIGAGLDSVRLTAVLVGKLGSRMGYPWSASPEIWK